MQLYATTQKEIMQILKEVLLLTLRKCHCPILSVNGTSSVVPLCNGLKYLFNKCAKVWVLERLLRALLRLCDSAL
jgi:hypothetical protein